MCLWILLAYRHRTPIFHNTEDCGFQLSFTSFGIEIGQTRGAADAPSRTAPSAAIAGASTMFDLVPDPSFVLRHPRVVLSSRHCTVRRRCFARLLGPPMPAVADPVEVLAAGHFGAAAIVVHANFVARAALFAAGARVREGRKARDVNRLRRCRHAALYPFRVGSGWRQSVHSSLTSGTRCRSPIVVIATDARSVGTGEQSDLATPATTSVHRRSST